MRDGTIFAGYSPDTGKPFYVDAADAPSLYTFDEAKKYAESTENGGEKGTFLISRRLPRSRLAGGFQAFLIEQDDLVLVVLRDIERNPVCAGLLDWVEDWPWSIGVNGLGERLTSSFNSSGGIA